MRPVCVRAPERKKEKKPTEPHQTSELDLASSRASGNLLSPTDPPDVLCFQRSSTVIRNVAGFNKVGNWSRGGNDIGGMYSEFSAKNWRVNWVGRV